VEEVAIEATQVGSKKNPDFGDMSKMFSLSSKFAIINRLITRDVNHNTITPIFNRYTKDDISTYLANPFRYERQLRDAVIYIYGASSHFRRLIQYFVGLSDLAYVVAPYKIDPATVNKKTLSRNYRKVLNTLESMNIKTQFPKILTVCFREDTFFGTMVVSADNIIIQQLPSNYCTIASIENGVPNVTFNFSYFDSHLELLDYYPPEFRAKYENIYKKNRSTRWIELDAPTSFAIKCNNDILDYSIPPFAGILREIYDLEDLTNIGRRTGNGAH